MSPDPGIPRRRKILLTLVAAPFLLLLIAAGLLFAALRGDFGRETLRTGIEALVSDEQGLTLALGRIEGDLLSDFRIARIALGDPGGNWLVAEDLRVSWTPAALFQRRLEIANLDLANLDFRRQPDLPSEPDADDETGDGGTVLPSLPLDIVLRDLQVGRIRLGEALAGQEAFFRLAMNLDAEREKPLRGNLDLHQLEGGRATLSVQLDFHPEKQTLGVDATLSEPENGLLARALALPGAPALEVTILGDGTLSSWHGRMTARAGDLLDAEFLLETRAEDGLRSERIQLDLQGHTRFAALLPAEVRNFVEPRLDVEAGLLWDESAQRIALTSAQFESAALRVTGEGAFGVPEETVSAKLSLLPLDKTAFAPLIAPADFEEAKLDLALEGSLRELSADLSVLARRLSIDPGIVAERVTGSFRTTLSPDDPKLIPLTGQASIEGLTGLPPEAARLLGDRLRLAFDLRMDLPQNRVDIRDLQADGAGLTASGEGTLELASRTAEASLAVSLPDLSLLGPVSGSLRADIDARSDDFETPRAAITLQATARSLDPGVPQIKALLGDAVELRAKAAAGADSLTVESFDLSTAVARLTGSAQFPLSLERVAADFRLDLPALAPFSDLAGTALAGQGDLRGRLEGGLEDPQIHAVLELRKIALDSQALGNLRSEISASNLVSGPRGTLKSRLSHPETTPELTTPELTTRELTIPELTADLSTGFALADPDRLDLTDLVLSLAGARIQGDVAVPLNGAPVTGRLEGRVADLRQLAALAGQPARGALDFTATLEQDGTRQNARLDLNARDLKLGDGNDNGDEADGPSVARLDASVVGRDLLAEPGMTLSAKAASLRAGGFGLDNLTLDARGTPQSVDFDFALDSTEAPTLAFTGAGAVALGDVETTLSLQSLDGRFLDRPVRLLQPVTLRQGDGETRIDSLRLAVDTGEVALEGRAGPAAASASLSFAALPLTLLALIDPQLESEGTLEGRADLGVVGDKADGRFEFRALDAKPKGPDFANLPSLNALLSGRLAGGRVDFNGNVTGLQDTEISTQGFLPLDVALAPAAVAVPQDRPAEARLTLRGDLGSLWPLLALDGHQLAGRLSADMRLAGTLGSPRLSGSANLDEGRYENLEQGTLLTAMNLSVTLPDAQTVELALGARDGEDGRIESKGRIDLGNSADPGITLNTTLARARLLRRDDVSAQASGNIGITGNSSALSVTGEILTDNVEIDISSTLPPTIVEMPVEELNRPDGGGASSGDGNGNGEDAAAATMKLDLDLSMPRRVFIRGRGLESEWSGRFRIAGTTDAPVIQGDLRPVRGDFSFAGKSFKLQQGKVSLLGGKEIDPVLDLSAVYQVEELKAIVRITGTTSSPEIAFSSEPELPQDEILARVLFGKSTGQLTPVEALQLAEAVGTITGKLGSGGGIVGFVRDTLGVDVLNAGTNQDTGKAEVSVGKYLTDDVYVGVDQGADPGSTKVTVEVEVTPNITVESDVGNDASGRVGVFWKWDY